MLALNASGREPTDTRLSQISEDHVDGVVDRDFLSIYPQPKARKFTQQGFLHVHPEVSHCLLWSSLVSAQGSFPTRVQDDEVEVEVAKHPTVSIQAVLVAHNWKVQHWYESRSCIRARQQTLVADVQANLAFLLFMRLLAGVDSPTDDPFAKTVTLDMDGTWQSRGQAAGNRGLAGSGNACYEPRVVGWTAHRGDEAMGIRGTKSCSRSPVTFRCGRLGRVQDRSAFKRPTSYGGALRACVEGRLSAARHVSRLRARQAATAQFLEDRLGQVSAYAHSISVGQDGARSSQGRSERPVPLLVAQDVLQLPAEHVLVFHRDQPPARAERADWRTVSGLRSRQGFPTTPVPTLPPGPGLPDVGDNDRTHGQLVLDVDDI